jgi:PAS domain S-box-containing protein
METRPFGSNGGTGTVTNGSSRMIADLGPGDHLCCIYKTEEEHRSVVTSFLRRGLEQGEKVIYIVDTHTAETILGYLQNDGLDVKPYLTSGQLVVLTRDETYMREGSFDVERMIGLLRSETERALAEGYPALRVTGEMTWALRGLPGSERLIEYEARLNEFFPGSQCLAICQYDRRRFDPAVLLDVLRTHPIVVVGMEVYDNFYYIPPAVLLDGDLSAAELRYWLQNLAERKRMEELSERLLAQVAQDRQSTEELARTLEREQDTLQTIMENTHAHLAYLDPQFNFVRVNSAYAWGAGYSKEELIGRNHFELFPHAENQAIFERVRETGEPVAFHAKPFVYPDRPELGTTYWDWTLVPVKDGNGQVRGLVLSLLDITERKRAEEALRRYADRLQVLHDLDQAIVAAHSVEEIAEAALRHVRQLVPCLQASVTVFDFEADEMSLLAADADSEIQLGKGWRGSLEWAWFVEELTKGQVHVVEDILALPPSSPLMEVLQAKGVRAYVNVPIFYQGEPIGSLNLGMASPGDIASEQADIAREIADELAIGIHHARLHEQVRRYAAELEQRVAERTAELRATEARFRTIFEGAAIGMALVDMEGRLVQSNPALQEMLGYSSEEFHGLVFTEFTHPDDATADMDLYQELMAGKRDYYKMEKRYIRKDGQSVWANLTVSLIRGAGGEPQFAIGTVEDITKRKQAQAALVQAEKLTIAGKLAASLAHEINNPLQSVIGCIGLAEEVQAEGGDVSRYLEVAHEELRRAASIVVQLRDLHRRSRPEDKELTDVNALLEQVLTLSRKKCESHGVDVSRAIADLPPLPVVPDRIKQVFLNLLLNAIEAMPEGGRLQVSTSQTSQPAGVRVAFTDSGAGIASDVLTHIFDPFYSTKPEGLGLGLFISQDIVKQHGGHIEVDSQVGEGTTFTVLLPA